jgi:hypothetical protein
LRRSITSERDAVERILRSARPEPTAELVADLSARVAESQQQVRRGSRFAFAAALVVLVVGTFLSFGGAAYAAAGQTVSSQKSAASAGTSSASDEYGTQAVATVPPTSSGSTSPGSTSSVAGATASAPPAQSGTLPFTGVGLGSTVVLSLLLVSLGVYLRRRESRE